MAVTKPTPTLTIGRLARAAGVGVETIRYYQRRGLLPALPRGEGVRRYSGDLVLRIQFIKRAQALGFTLDEVASLLALQDGGDRRSIRAITDTRLRQIEDKIAALAAMRTTLVDLLARCEAGARNLPCPIIASLAACHAPAPTVPAAGRKHEAAHTVAKPTATRPPRR